MDDWKRFEESELPSIEAFTSQLRAGECITVEEYAHAKNVFNHFNMQSLQEYHDLYLLQDVFLLADVLAAFRAVCLSTFKLDPLHYYTAPGLTWDAGLKYTGVELQLLTDEEQHLFVEAGIRGGISMISHRHARLNHPDFQHMGYYDPAKPIESIQYWDMNNLYGYAMMEPLPISDFAMSRGNFNLHSMLNWVKELPKDFHHGYILEIDCEVPQDKHDYFAGYPLAPVSKSVTGTMLSNYQRDILEENLLNENRKNPLTPDQRTTSVDQFVSNEKLLLDLEPKMKYVVHYRTLQLYLKLGLRVTKIHRVLKFIQKAWLKPYILMNTEKRMQATSEFEKNFYKLMINAFFGKTMENIRKRRHIDIVSSPEKLRKLVAQPTFKCVTAFNEHLSAVERYKAKVMLNKPIYIGLSVLDISKWLMYHFYYNIIHKIFPPDAVRLLFTDTDSLCISIRDCCNVYDRLRDGIIEIDGEKMNIIDLFDVSNFPDEHRIFKTLNPIEVQRQKKKNKKVPGKMKDELNGNILLEFVGLRAKAYAMKSLVLHRAENEHSGSIHVIKKLKGVQSAVVSKHATFNHYLSSIFERKRYTAETTSIQSSLHEVRTLSIKKSAMGPYDDKRFLLDDGITSLPYGHYSIQNH